MRVKRFSVPMGMVAGENLANEMRSRKMFHVEHLGLWFELGCGTGGKALSTRTNGHRVATSERMFHVEHRISSCSLSRFTGNTRIRHQASSGPRAASRPAELTRFELSSERSTWNVFVGVLVRKNSTTE